MSFEEYLTENASIENVVVCESFAQNTSAV